MKIEIHFCYNQGILVSGAEKHFSSHCKFFVLHILAIGQFELRFNRDGTIWGGDSNRSGTGIELE